MEVRIGISNSPREISFESSLSPAQVEKVVADALSSGAAFFRLEDEKGRLFMVPTASFAFLEVGPEVERRVGFVA